MSSKFIEKGRKVAVLGGICLLCLSAVSCISYSYTGIAQAEKMPDQGIIGMSRETLINVYGMPQRVMSLKERGSYSSGDSGESPRRSEAGDSMADDQVVYVYRRMAQHKVILYERTRESTYAVYLTDGKVSEVKTTLTAMGDGISISPVLPGGAAKPN